MRGEDEREYVMYVTARWPALRLTAYRLCGDWHTAEDLVQQTFIRLYRNWRRVVSAANVDAYVRTILVHTFVEGRRGWWARRVRLHADPVPREAQPPGADAAGAQDGRMDLMAALARISPGQRAVLVLRFWEGLDVTETAHALGCSAGTVKSQTSAGIAALRRLMPGYLSERAVGR
jgi:RNA polymerase sigma-70 factor (sigma-E family)